MADRIEKHWQVPNGSVAAGKDILLEKIRTTLPLSS